jgi:hypothetical protein
MVFLALITVSAIWKGRAGLDYVGCVLRTHLRKSGGCVKRTLRKYSFRRLVAATMIKAVFLLIIIQRRAEVRIELHFKGVKET